MDIWGDRAKTQPLTSVRWSPRLSGCTVYPSRLEHRGAPKPANGLWRRGYGYMVEAPLNVGVCLCCAIYRHSERCVRVCCAVAVHPASSLFHNLFADFLPALGFCLLSSSATSKSNTQLTVVTASKQRCESIYEVRTKFKFKQER